MKRSEMESWEERAAYDLCVNFNVEPWRCVPRDPDRGFIGYEGDYYMNWAREKIQEALAIRQAIASSALVPAPL
jgi:hypothetical protein